MKRRDFLKALAAITGGAAISPAIVRALPKHMPDDMEIAVMERRINE